VVAERHTRYGTIQCQSFVYPGNKREVPEIASSLGLATALPLTFTELAASVGITASAVLEDPLHYASLELENSPRTV
jgi:hypothetical protein